MECCDDHLFVFILTLVILMMLKLWRDRRSYDDRLLRAERTIDTLRLLLAQTQSVLKIKSEFIVANEFRCKKKATSDQEFRSRWEEQELFLADLSFAVQDLLQKRVEVI